MDLSEIFTGTVLQSVTIQKTQNSKKTRPTENFLATAQNFNSK